MSFALNVVQAYCHLCFVSIKPTMLSVVMPSVIKQHFNIQSVVLPGVIRQSFIMLSCCCTKCRGTISALR